jgi:hypothetical protein
LRGIDCRRPQVDRPIDGLAVRGKTPIFVYLAWRLWRSVLRLAVRGNSISGRVVRRQRVPVFEGHRLPSTASRWDDTMGELSWKNADFCVFSVSAMAKCFESCG